MFNGDTENFTSIWVADLILVTILIANLHVFENDIYALKKKETKSQGRYILKITAYNTIKIIGIFLSSYFIFNS